MDDELIEVVFLEVMRECMQSDSLIDTKDMAHESIWQIACAAYLARATQFDLVYWNIALGDHAQI